MECVRTRERGIQLRYLDLPKSLVLPPSRRLSFSDRPVLIGTALSSHAIRALGAGIYVRYVR